MGKKKSGELERRTAQARLGTAPIRLQTKGNCGNTWCGHVSSLSMDPKWQGRQESAALKDRPRPGLIAVICDGSPTNRSRVIKAYPSAEVARWIPLEQLPDYAIELKPTERIWNYLKVVNLANIAYDFLSELETFIQELKKRVQHKPELIQAFFLDAGCEI